MNQDFDITPYIFLISSLLLFQFIKPFFNVFLFLSISVTEIKDKYPKLALNLQNIQHGQA